MIWYDLWKSIDCLHLQTVNSEWPKLHMYAFESTLNIQDFFSMKMKKDNAFEQRHEISNNVVYGTSKASDQPARTLSLIRAFASRLNILSLLSY